ncbi:CYAC3 protein, partial [Lophotis ruficrista]|nr:CYAC3 protein [Lophotis ruficrista]
SSPGVSESRRGRAGSFPFPRCRRPAAEMLALPFPPFCVLLGGLGFACVAFVGAWCQRWRGGFAWDGSAQMFNWHPVLMVTGMVVLYGAGERGARRGTAPARLPPDPFAPPPTAALVYRLPPAWRGPKLPWKVLHGALALAAFALAVLGLVAVFRFHDRNGTPNMYSLHSWLGLATVLLFSCQVASAGRRGEASDSPAAGAWLPRPAPCRGAAWVLGEGWAHPGKLSASFFPPRKNGTTEYKRLPAEAVFANTLGLLILLFGVLVLGALARPSWKRPDADSPDSCQ